MNSFSSLIFRHSVLSLSTAGNVCMYLLDVQQNYFCILIIVGNHMFLCFLLELLILPLVRHFLPLSRPKTII